MRSTALFIGSRYASLRSSNQLVSFISLLSVAGLSLGVAVLITVLSVMNGFDRELQQRILALVPHLTVTTARNEPLLSEAQWAPYRQAMLELPEVTGVAPYLQLQGMLLAKGVTKGVLINGINPNSESDVSIISDFIDTGELAALAVGSYNIAIGKTLAQTLGVSLGDTLMLVSTVVPLTPMGEFTRQKQFTVGAIFSVGSQIDSTMALINLQDAQRLYRMGEGIHGFRIQTNDLFATGALSQKLQEVLPEDVSYSQWINVYGNIYENIRFSKNLVGLLLTLLVGVAAFNVVVSLVMVVRDKQGDIAILRTMGTPMVTIRRIFLVQGFLIGLAGTGAGLLLGIIFSLSAGSAVIWLESILGMQLLSSEIYPVNYLPTDIRASDLFLVCSLSLGLSLLATLYPSSCAGRTRPAEVLRYE